MKIRRLLYAIAGALSFYAGASRAQERFDAQVRNDFFAGFSGNAEAMARAMALTEQVLADNPQHAEAMVWQGAGVYYRAGQAFQKGDPQTGMQLAAKGVGLMDAAVALEPDNVAVRVPRGAVLLTATRFQAGPHVAPMVARGLSDYRKVFEIQQSYFDKVGTHAKGELLLGLADGHNRTGDAAQAKQFYQRAAAELPGTPYERAAKEWLTTGKLAPQKAGCLGCHTGK